MGALQVLVLASCVFVGLCNPRSPIGFGVSNARGSVSAQTDQIFLLAALAEAASASPGYLQEYDVPKHNDPTLNNAHPEAEAKNAHPINTGYSIFARASLLDPNSRLRGQSKIAPTHRKPKHHSPSLNALGHIATTASGPKSLGTHGRLSSRTRPTYKTRDQVRTTQQAVPELPPRRLKTEAISLPLPVSGDQADSQYSIQYTVKDDYSGNNFGHQEDRKGYRTQGVYFVLLPDGRIQKVTYYVDGESGFVAEVTYEGGTQIYTR